jgi:Gas vesicle synthesis protein GvpL/GvpF
VSLDEFGERGLRDSLEDLDRLEALARAHERVLDEALRMGAVVPFRICTVYAGAERVHEMHEHEPLPWRCGDCAAWRSGA